MEVVRTEEQQDDQDVVVDFAGPFEFVLQNYAFICARTMFYHLNLNSFVGIAAKFAY
jgi:hypothetical protein